MWLKATPEEKVRQYFCHFLTDSCAYPPVAIANEVEVMVNGQPQRCDTLVYRQGIPVMVVEYKRPEVAITQQVFNQIARYNLILHVPLMVVSNGKVTYCLHVTGGKPVFLPSVPTWQQIASL